MALEIIRKNPTHDSIAGITRFEANTLNIDTVREAVVDLYNTELNEQYEHYEFPSEKRCVVVLEDSRMILKSPNGINYDFGKVIRRENGGYMITGNDGLPEEFDEFLPLYIFRKLGAYDVLSRYKDQAIVVE